MKKIVTSAILAIALMAGTSAYAQTDGSTGATSQKGQQECCQTENGKKAEKKGKKGGKKDGKLNKGNKPKFNPFEGVQLTQDQQQRLQVLRQGLGPVELTTEQQAKIKENPNLTPEQKQQLKAEKKAKKMEAKKNYLNGVKEILTPDQYVIFLENCYLFAPQKQDKAQKHDKMFKGPKGERDKKQPRSNTSAK